MTPGTAPTRRRILAVAGALLLPRAVRRAAGEAPSYCLTFRSAPPDEGQPSLGAFRQGLRALGYSDEDIEIEERYADGHAERLPDLAADLVRLAPEVIVATGPRGGGCQTGDLDDPDCHVGHRRSDWPGLVASLAHPGGNVTGLAISRSNSGEAAGAAQDRNSQRRAHRHPAQPRQPENILQLPRPRDKRPQPCAPNFSPSKPALPTTSTAPSPRWCASTPMPSSSRAIPSSLWQRARSRDSRPATNCRQSIRPANLWRLAA